MDAADLTPHARTDAVDAYRRSQDCFDRVLVAVPSHEWDAPSACESWTVRDVVGHVIWGQELVRHLAADQDFSSQEGAPGAEHPAQLAGENPLTNWRTARDAANAARTDEALERPAPPKFVAAHPGAKLADFLDLLLFDFLAHSWDIGHPLGLHVRLPPDLLALSLPTARNVVVRAPGMFAPELTPPARR